AAIDFEILVVVGEVAEGRFGPEPLADHAGIDVGQRFVDTPTDERSEIHEQRKRLHWNARVFERRLEQRKLKRRKARRERRHANQGNRFEILVHLIESRPQIAQKNLRNLWTAFGYELVILLRIIGRDFGLW